MFGVIATLIFVTASVLSITVIATMFAAYREKMIAALLAQPIPVVAPTYHVEIRRRRVRPVTAQMALCTAPVVRAA